MAYPRSLLAPDEAVIIDARPHWKGLIGAAVVSLLSIALVIFAWWWVSQAEISDGIGMGLGIAASVIATALIVWLAVAPYIRWSTTHFVITDRRVIYRTGVFTKSGIDIPLARINTVQFRHGLVDRMFRTGTLIIESASDDPLSFDDIPQVERVHALLYDEVFDTLRRDEDDDEGPAPAPPASTSTP